MTDKEIRELSDKIAQKIEKLIAAGIDDRILLSIEIRYIIMFYLNDKKQKQTGHALEEGEKDER